MSKVQKLDKCLNCRSSIGMSSHHAVGIYDGDTYFGGVCPNCMFYPERLSTNSRTLLELYAPAAIRP